MFKITDPHDKILYVKKDKKEGIFYFNADVIGIYKFEFENEKYMENKQVTFALHCGNATDETL